MFGEPLVDVLFNAVVRALPILRATPGVASLFRKSAETAGIGTHAAAILPFVLIAVLPAVLSAKPIASGLAVVCAAFLAALITGAVAIGSPTAFASPIAAMAEIGCARSAGPVAAFAPVIILVIAGPVLVTREVPASFAFAFVAPAFVLPAVGLIDSALAVAPVIQAVSASFAVEFLFAIAVFVPFVTV